MTRVLVEVEDLADSARNAYDYVAWPLSRAAVRLEAALFDAGGMAGDDPAGREWAQAYDEAAAGALRAFGAVVDGCFRLASLFGSSARTYAEADWLSSAGERADIAALTAGLPRDASFSPLTAPPTAVGLGAGLPRGWGLVHDLVGYAWPNGHQDRLHHAARAWYAASAALHSAADEAGILPVLFTGHGLPEAADIETVCSGTSHHLRSLGHVFRTLGHACAELAAAIDWAHHEVLVDLALLGAQIAATETLAGLTAVVTFGLSEGVGQAAVAEECTVTAADIAGKLAQFASRVGDVLLRIPPVRDLADDVALAMERLRAARPARPAFAGVPTLPRATPMLRTGGSGEVAATQRLAAGPNLRPPCPSRLVNWKPGDEGIWARPSTLPDHFLRHGASVRASTEAEYAAASSNLLRRAFAEGLPMKIDSNGTIRVWDPRTKMFGSYRSDGSTRTFYRVGDRSYWDRQPGRSV